MEPAFINTVNLTHNRPLRIEVVGQRSSSSLRDASSDDVDSRARSSVIRSPEISSSTRHSSSSSTDCNVARTLLSSRQLDRKCLFRAICHGKMYSTELTQPASGSTPWGCLSRRRASAAKPAPPSSSLRHLHLVRQATSILFDKTRLPLASQSPGGVPPT